MKVILSSFHDDKEPFFFFEVAKSSSAA
ncbi:MAG: hypothetical protein ACI8S6_005564, partial [Myxococcota bacterium]